MDARSIAKNAHGHVEHRHSSRRDFLAAASALCAVASLATHKDAIAADGSKLIDTHHHFYPPSYQKAWADWEDQRKIPHLGVQFAWSREQDIEAMEKVASPLAYCRYPQRPGPGSTATPKTRTTRRDCAAISPPKWSARSPAVTACSRRSRCSMSTQP
jgi:hypothetical protein